jgi:hypothetical protein
LTAAFNRTNCHGDAQTRCRSRPRTAEQRVARHLDNLPPVGDHGAHLPTSSRLLRRLSGQLATTLTICRTSSTASVRCSMAPLDATTCLVCVSNMPKSIAIHGGTDAMTRSNR